MSRTLVKIGIFAVALGAGSAALAAVAPERAPQAREASSAAARSACRSHISNQPFTIPKFNSVIAKARVPRVGVYAKPRAARPFTVFENPNRYGSRLIFLVVWSRPYWLWPTWVRVRLPARPNGATGWIRARDVCFFLDPFRVQVDLSEHRLTVWKGRRVFHREAVGVGRPETPTPVGRYYLAELIKMTNPTGLYGPWAFGTNAFSNVLEQFGGRPGQIGIHGTNYPAGLGTDVSHGCIRMSNRGITKLARTVPIGTPLEIRR